jgi:hypothetical protein
MLINRFGIGLDDSGAGVPDHLRNKQIRHACSIQSAGERVSQVVNPEVVNLRSLQSPRPTPADILQWALRMSLVGKR